MVQRKMLLIIVSTLTSVLLFTSLLVFLSSVCVYAAPTESHTGLSSAILFQQQTYTPVVTITLPVASAVLTTVHLPTYSVQVKYNCGTLCIGSALLDVVSVTVNGGVAYHEAISDALLGRYVYDWFLPSTEDYVSHALIARARNGWGNIGASGPVTVYMDTIPPQGAAITIPTYTEKVSFTVSWSAADGSGVVKYDLQYRRDDQTAWTDWLTNTETTSYVFTVPPQVVEEGHAYAFRMSARDIGNNCSDWVTEMVRLGRYHIYLPLVLRNYPAVPTGSVAIEWKAATVYQRSVTLALTATVSAGTVVEMRFSNDGVHWDAWENYATTKSWLLTDGISGIRTVYVQFKGSQGGISEPTFDRTYLLFNGGFEAGDFTAWQHGGELNQFVNTAHPRTGVYSALLGDPSYPNTNVPGGSAWAYQIVEVPNIGAPALSFWYRIFTYDVMWSSNHQSYYDYFDVTLEDTSGNTLERLLRDGFTGQWQENVLQDLNWRSSYYDLSAYRGQTIRVRFANHNTGGATNDLGLNTYTYLDNVVVEGDW